MPKNDQKIQQNKEYEIFVLLLVAALVSAVYLGWIKMPTSVTFGDFLVLEGEKSTKEEGDTMTENLEEAALFKEGEAVYYEGYSQGRGWKGVVRSIEDDDYTIELTEIITHSEVEFDLFPQPCSGNKVLNKNSVGKQIKVPKECLLKHLFETGS